MKNNKWCLEDAQKIADKFPDSFYKPSNEVVAKLKRGKVVKLIFNFESDNPYHPSAERMWVSITKVNKKGFVGQLASMPCFIRGLVYGDTIKFEARHIIDVEQEYPVISMPERYADFCVVTKNIVCDGEKVGFLLRDKNDYEHDSGWFITAGYETEEYMDNDDNLTYATLSDVLEVDNSIVSLLKSEYGSAFFRNEDGNFEELE
jgi:hypothetical protein